MIHFLSINISADPQFGRDYEKVSVVLPQRELHPVEDQGLVTGKGMFYTRNVVSKTDKVGTVKILKFRSPESLL